MAFSQGIVNLIYLPPTYLSQLSHWYRAQQIFAEHFCTSQSGLGYAVETNAKPQWPEATLLTHQHRLHEHHRLVVAVVTGGLCSITSDLLWAPDDKQLSPDTCQRENQNG